VVGYSNTNAGFIDAVRWDITNTSTGAHTITDLGNLGGTESEAMAISADSSTIVGFATTPGNAIIQAVLWNASHTGPQSLGAIPGLTNSQAAAVSGNGAIIVGSAFNRFSPIIYNPPSGDAIDGSSVAFRWTATTGMQNLNTLMAKAGVDLGGVTLLTANAISRDGAFIGGASVPAGSPSNTNTQAYLAKYIDAAVVPSNPTNPTNPSTPPTPPIAGITTADSVQQSVDGLGLDRRTIMAQERGFAAPLLGENSPIGGGSYVGAYGSGGSAAGGGGMRYGLGNLTLLGGLAIGSESYSGVEMNDALLFAGAARYVQPLMSRFSLLGEIGGWWSPSGNYQFSRNYMNGVGTATGVGQASGSQGYVFGRAGPVFNATAADELALTGEIGWQRLSTDGYLEPLSSANPFNASVSSGADTMNVVKVRGQWTHAFTPVFDATISADYAHGFNYSTNLVATVEGIGTLSPTLRRSIGVSTGSGWDITTQTVSRSRRSSMGSAGRTWTPASILAAASSWFSEREGASSPRAETRISRSAVTHIHYFPLGVGVATLFLAILLALLFLIQLLGRAYSALGLDSRVATLVLFGSLIGSYINLPLARLPDQRVVSREVVEIFGVPFLAPVAVDWPGTILAINVGGAVIPIMLSFYLLVRYDLWGVAAVATAIVALVVHRLATPIPGVGISVPTFAPPLMAAGVALVLARRFAAPIAYIGGSLGVLIGADLTNLGRLRSLGAPVASIGGAGTFDGIFLTGVIAVLLASLVVERR
jgi:uncharacterized membrane protein